jgi:CBS domain containing-hemolysin-like protein
MSVGIWIVLAILILANALYVAAEFGAVGVRRSRVRRLSDDGHRLARRLLPYVEHPAALDRYVGASQVGITISSLMVGAYAQATLSVGLAVLLIQLLSLEPTTARSVAAILVLALLTAVQVILGELVPKALALQYPTETALATVLPLQWSLRLFRPAIVLLNGAATILLRLLGVKAQSHRHLHSPEELDLLIAESRDGGLLEPVEQQRLRRALHLARRTARDLMVPLDRLTMIDIDTEWDDLLPTVLSTSFSRLPVYRGSRTQIVGHLRVKDLLDRYLVHGRVPVAALTRPMAQVPATLDAPGLLALLRSRRAHAVIVTEPDGATAGVVTIQDVLTELLGLRGATDVETDRPVSRPPA